MNKNKINLDIHMYNVYNEFASKRLLRHKLK